MRSKAKWMCCIVAILGLVATGSQAALLDDDFTGSAGSPLDSGTWTGIYNYTENGSSYATYGAAANGGFRSVSTFGGAGSPTITAEFLGVKTRLSLDSLDNYWGLWGSPPAWKPTGVAFVMGKYDDDSSQRIRYVLVGTTRYTADSPFTLELNTLYDFKVVWTSGAEAKFYATTAGNSVWTLVRSVSGAGIVPSDALTVRVRSESIGLDVDRITVVPEPATMALLAFGGIGLLVRRRQRA